MYTKLLQSLAPLFLLLAACGAPTVEKVAFECAKQNKTAGQLVTIDNIGYNCPTVPNPTSTPETINTHLNQTVAELCQTNNPVWLQPETAQWLADHVGGDTYDWSHTDSSWIYDPPAGIDTNGQAAGFVYPGFGTVHVTEYWSNNLITVTASNQHVLPRLRFTKLELTCP